VSSEISRNTDSISQRLAAFCARSPAHAIPDDARRRAGELTLDFLAVVGRAAAADSSAMVRDAARALSGSGPCSVIGAQFKLAPQYAALVNGATGHAIEMDDVTEESSLHPGVVVFPAAFAMAEMTHAGGEEFLTSVILGYEVICRLGNAINIKSHYARGFHPTATCGTFAAAAIAARLMKLDAGRTAHALAIAGSMAAGSMEYMDNGSLIKRVHPGLAAHAGIVAAQLAASGITGPREIIEGAHGFLRAYSHDAYPERVLADLGTRWEVTETAIKPHACCRHNHAAIDAVLEIVRRENLSAEQVTRIRAFIPTSSLPIVAEPREIKFSPKSVVDAQFSLPFALAVTVRYRRALLSEYTLAAIENPQVQRLLGLIECRGDEELDRVFPETWPARVEIESVGGRRFVSAVANAKGSPRNPLSREELSAKARGLLDGVLSPADQDELIDVTARIDELPEVSPLLAPLFARIPIPV
jgi:2-methylcitrate dehydratase PrpD